ncbi:MAG: hypothetical protein E7A86_36010, partial [Bradyrhizobium sp.]|nr:hypothetical protein [Bradyrhizobium sp.]
MELEADIKRLGSRPREMKNLSVAAKYRSRTDLPQAWRSQRSSRPVSPKIACAWPYVAERR